MVYQLHEVVSAKQKQQFLDMPSRLYRSEANWIRPFDKDVEAVFDPKQNKLFRTGKAIRWILANPEGEIVGRVAAFFESKSASKNQQPTGGMGFFECIPDREAAFKLFDACRDWLSSQGMEAMDGPVNFGDRDKFWGLQVEGEFPPLYGMFYHKSYYRDFFEAYGFRSYFEQYTYHRKIGGGGVSLHIREKADRIFKDPLYSFRMLQKNDADRYAEDFMTVFNKGWAKFPGVNPITKVHALALLKSMKPIMDERLLWFGYYGDEPVAFFLMMPDINQIVRHLNGKFGLWQKMLFFYHLKIRKSITGLIGLIFGVVPQHQGKGIEGALVVSFEKVALRSDFPYTDLELNWIADFNPAMMKVAEQVGGRVRKTHITYRLLFDPEKPFQRARKMNVRDKENPQNDSVS